MKTDVDIRGALKDWLHKTNPRNTTVIEDSTPIIENRIITSLQVMDLILYIEQLRGKRIEIEELKAGVFNNIDTIHASFFGT